MDAVNLQMKLNLIEQSLQNYFKLCHTLGMKKQNFEWEIYDPIFMGPGSEYVSGTEHLLSLGRLFQL